MSRKNKASNASHSKNRLAGSRNYFFAKTWANFMTNLISCDVLSLLLFLIQTSLFDKNK